MPVSAATECRRAQPLLGTLVEISAHGPDAPDAVAEAFRAVAQAHGLMSYHDPASDISRLNREAGMHAVAIHAWTWQVLDAARAFAEASDGLFDISIAPTLTRLGYLPRHADMPRASHHASWRDIELLPDQHVRFARPLRIDLGGIAKGFVVDQAIATLQTHGAHSGCVNAGGDLRLFGASAQTVHVRHPHTPSVLLPLTEIRDGAAATSARYFAERLRMGQAISPHIDPRTGLPNTSDRSVTVLANECMTADALTKIALADRDAARPVLARFGARALTLDRDTHTGAWRLHDSACPAQGHA